MRHFVPPWPRDNSLFNSGSGRSTVELLARSRRRISTPRSTTEDPATLRPRTTAAPCVA